MAEPATINSLKETLTQVYKQLVCIDSALAAGDEEAATHHLVKAMNEIGDPRAL